MEAGIWLYVQSALAEIWLSLVHTMVNSDGDA